MSFVSLLDSEMERDHCKGDIPRAAFVSVWPVVFQYLLADEMYSSPPLLIYAIIFSSNVL